jgi:hypothetical protein
MKYMEFSAMTEGRVRDMIEFAADAMVSRYRNSGTNAKMVASYCDSSSIKQNGK